LNIIDYNIVLSTVAAAEVVHGMIAKSHTG